jgi:hypothetical protein
MIFAFFATKINKRKQVHVQIELQGKQFAAL